MKKSLGAKTLVYPTPVFVAKECEIRGAVRVIAAKAEPFSV